MNAEEQKTIYLSKVASQIYSARTRKEVTAELSTHIDEEFEALNVRISDSKEAMRRTLEDIGEPCRLGSHFNLVHPLHILKYLAASILLTLLLYNGTIASFIDFPSILLVLLIGLVLFSIRILKSKYYFAIKRNLIVSFLWSGSGISVVLLLLGIENGSIHYPYWQINLLPLWYGLLSYLLFASLHLLKNLHSYRRNAIKF